MNPIIKQKEALADHDHDDTQHDNDDRKEYMVTWSNINYEIVIPQKQNKEKTKSLKQLLNSNNDEPLINGDSKSKDTSIRKILRDINGFALPFEIHAIMGPSGCGKTSLLNIIAERQLPVDKSLNKITRKVDINGHELTSDNFGNLCAYIMQDDIMMDCLTPKETLLFGAKLRLNCSYDEICRRVNELIEQFGLRKCENTRIGNEVVRGVSGAYELITDPPIIFVDEPTTGMDSYTSLVIVQYLKTLALTGKTIVCTIHQPGSSIFEYIDRITLIKEGNLIYQGESKLALSYFDRLGYPFPAFSNPFDFFLERLSDPNANTDTLNNNYEQYIKLDFEDERAKYREKYTNLNISNQTLALPQRQVNPFYEQYLLTHRNFLQYFRNKKIFLVRLVQALLVSTLMAGFYWEIGKLDAGPRFLQNYTGFFFNLTNNFYINGIFTTLLSLPLFEKVLKRENAAKFYRVSSYYVSSLLTFLIPSISYALIMTTMTFFTTQLQQDLSTYFVYFLINLFVFFSGCSVGFLIGTFFRGDVPMTVAPLIFILFMLGSGFYRTNESFPAYFRFLNYISPYRYFLELQFKNEKDFNLVTEKIPSILGYDFGIGVCLEVLFGMLVIFLVLGYFALKYRVKRF